MQRRRALTGLMSSERVLLPLAVSIFALGNGCRFDTTPLQESTGQAGVDAGMDSIGPSSAVSGAPATEASAPTVAVAESVRTDMSAASVEPAGSSDAAQATPIAQSDASTTAGMSQQPSAATSQLDAGLQPATSAESETQTMGEAAATSSSGCAPGSSFGLQVQADMTWGASGSFLGPGRGTAEVYVLLHLLDQLDTSGQRVVASGRVCGMTLPPMGMQGSCTLSSLELPETLWEQPGLPEVELEARYSCDASSCMLALDPISYLLGIELDDRFGPWPAAGAAAAATFVDNDSDDQPGVTATLSTQRAPAVSAGPCVTSGFPAGFTGATGMEIDRAFLGVRAQLDATLQLSSACELIDVSGDMPAIELRAAGCHIKTSAMGQGRGPSADRELSDNCSEFARNTLDEQLPQYGALEMGEAPPAAVVAVGGDAAASRGTIVRAVRLASRRPGSCEELRRAMF